MASVNKVGGQIIKQDDALLISAVNDVIEKGRNLCDCYGFSSKAILHINDKREFNNDYGTSISTIEPINKVIATQAQAPNSDNVNSDNNGYFYIGVKGMKPSKSYVLSFDFTPTKMLLESSSLLILVSGRFPSSPVSVNELNVKKRVAFPFEYKVIDDRQFLEIRLSGMSGIFENFQLDEGNIETAYTPYHAPISHPIPQSILSLDGYGWSAGQAYNYVDFENKKYYKCVDKVDLGTFEEIYPYSGVTPEEGRYVYAINIIAIKTKSNSKTICELFDSVSFDELISKDGMFLNSAYNQLLISTSKCKSIKELKSYINGKHLYYELAEPIVTDISELIGDTFQEPFEVESGGSFTFKNTNGDGYRIAVPSDIQYTVALSEVNA